MSISPWGRRFKLGVIGSRQWFKLQKRKKARLSQLPVLLVETSENKKKRTCPFHTAHLSQRPLQPPLGEMGCGVVLPFFSSPYV